MRVVVLDTNVLISAGINPVGPPGKIVKSSADPSFKPTVFHPIGWNFSLRTV